MNSEFNGVYNGITVLVTGHTGFKGSWLALWLEKLGAKVIGYSLEELPTNPSNFELCHLGSKIVDIRGDIRDIDRLQKVIETHKPRIVFHLAAQPIVLRAYDEPKLTIDTNAGGTVNVLEAIRRTNYVDALVSITTDKVYKNKEWVWGYRENDMLGDTDPYSAGKAMAEFAIDCYRTSFFSKEREGFKPVGVASARAGNVIGGGDFAEKRLVPDSMKALMAGVSIEIRNPVNVRPWQLVLEPLSGYLWLGAKLLEKSVGGAYDRAWNFGPMAPAVTAGEVADELVRLWGEGSWINVGHNEAKKESNLLMLDWTSAYHYMGWRPVYTWKEALNEIVDWFRKYQEQKESTETGINMYKICSDQVDKYTSRAKELGISWAVSESAKLKPVVVK